jgi:hypothetical protein
MYIKVVAPHQTSRIECDRVDLRDGEVTLLRGGEIAACFINGEGWRFYVLSNSGATIDAWSGTEKEAAPAPA